MQIPFSLIFVLYKRQIVVFIRNTGILVCEASNRQTEMSVLSSGTKIGLQF